MSDYANKRQCLLGASVDAEQMKTTMKESIELTNMCVTVDEIFSNCDNAGVVLQTATENPLANPGQQGVCVWPTIHNECRFALSPICPDMTIITRAPNVGMGGTRKRGKWHSTPNSQS